MNTRIVEFGTGKLIVDTGTQEGKPAVFIFPAKEAPGVVGTKAAERYPLHELQPGEIVLTFPTDAQARAVADALCGATS
jgi:hypothetical protein